MWSKWIRLHWRGRKTFAFVVVIILIQLPHVFHKRHHGNHHQAWVRAIKSLWLGLTNTGGNGANNLMVRRAGLSRGSLLSSGGWPPISRCKYRIIVSFFSDFCHHYYQNYHCNHHYHHQSCLEAACLAVLEAVPHPQMWIQNRQQNHLTTPFHQNTIQPGKDWKWPT